MNSEMPLVIEASELLKAYRRKSRFRHRLMSGIGLAASGAMHSVLGPLDLQVTKGASLGLIGRNGSGKSTLLKLLAGVTLPSAGRLRVQDSVSAVLELATGFHPHFSGRENARLQAALHGLDAQASERCLPEIEAFAGLGEAILEPVRTYSTGMVARLAFSAAMAVDAELLLIDEALAVGDAAFQERCYKRLESHRARGGTLVLATHSLPLLKRLCDRVLLLEKGRVLFDGSPDEAAGHYEKLLLEQD